MEKKLYVRARIIYALFFVANSSRPLRNLCALCVTKKPALSACKRKERKVRKEPRRARRLSKQ